jgi:hypothetical protein
MRHHEARYLKPGDMFTHVHDYRGCSREAGDKVFVFVSASWNEGMNYAFVLHTARSGSIEDWAMDLRASEIVRFVDP